MIEGALNESRISPRVLVYFFTIVSLFVKGPIFSSGIPEVDSHHEKSVRIPDSEYTRALESLHARLLFNLSK